MTRPVTLPPGMSLVTHDSLSSTNDEAKRLAAEEGAPEGTIVWAKHQTAGKGRQSRSWVSEPGNLYSSIILRPTVDLAAAAQASFLPALAVAEMLIEYTSSDNVTVKWPNDVMLGGKKICGILLESGNWVTTEEKWLVLGCGINVAHSPPEARLPATSVREETGENVELENALESYAAHLFNWVQRWQRDGFQPVREAWLERAAGLGSSIGVEIAGKRIDGTFQNLDNRGALVLETQNGVRTINAGDVYFASNEGAT